VVLTDGTVQIVQLMKTSNPKLSDAAREALSKWRFKPGTKDGKPIPVRVSIEVSFRPKP
jgi:TonB family protein